MLVKLTKDTTFDNHSIRSLTLGQVYVVIGIEANDYRILSDNNEPYIYDHVCFEVIDASEPEFWECKTGDEGERYCYPREPGKPGFFEDYHDGVPDARSKFWAVYQDLYGMFGKSSV